MTGKAEAAAAMVQDTAVVERWWRTATPDELRHASKVVNGFLGASAAAQAADVEAFARALALQQLLEDESAVKNAASAAYDAMPEPPRKGAPPELNSAAQAWLPRGKALDAGLRRCLVLLKHQENAEWTAFVNRFHMTLHLFELDCIAAVVHGGTTAAITVSKPLKFRPRKV